MPNGHPRRHALPANPDLEHLKNEAKERLALLRAAAPGTQLAEAQFQIARDYGFPSWRALKDRVENPGGELAACVGFYRHDPAFEENSYYSVTQSGAGLTAKHISGVKCTLVARPDGRFVSPGLSVVYGFEKDAAGQVQTMTIDDVDQHLRLRRIDAAAAAQIGAANAQARQEQRRPRTAIALAPEILDRHVGYYASSGGGGMEIAREDATLYLRIIGASRLPLSAASPDEFFIAHPAAGGQFSFRTEGDKTVALIMHQVGVERVIPRVTAEAAALASAQVTSRAEEQQQPRQTVSVPAPVLARYAGRYQITDDRMITVTAEEGKLSTQISGQPKRAEIFPESQTKFFWTVMAAQIEFFPDPDGRVRQAVFHTAGRLVPMARLDDAEAA